jgi:RNA polymerase sigma-70 factor (ECF subfamily)
MSTETPTFEAVRLEYGQFIRSTLAQLGVSARDLPDVEQEVLRGINRGLSTFDPSLAQNPATALRGWIFGICSHQAASQRRIENRHAELLRTSEEIADIQKCSAPQAEELLIAAQRKAVLHRLLSQVEPLRRAVVIAYRIEGVPMVEVAAAQAIPVNTAWNRLRLGLDDLRAAGRRMKAKEGPL